MEAARAASVRRANSFVDTRRNLARATRHLTVLVSARNRQESRSRLILARTRPDSTIVCPGLASADSARNRPKLSQVNGLGQSLVHSGPLLAPALAELGTDSAGVVAKLVERAYTPKIASQRAGREHREPRSGDQERRRPPKTNKKRSAGEASAASSVDIVAARASSTMPAAGVRSTEKSVGAKSEPRCSSRLEP